MNFNKHLNYEGQHAFLGASSYHWLNYSEEKIAEVYSNHLAKMKGTELHEFAAQCIRLGQKLPQSKKTLNMYVNDAIGFKMTPEQVLVYSDNCFGTADSISFRNNILRIHDYKSGKTPASMNQLKIYAAIFCLEYGIKPDSIKLIELRIYQFDDIFYDQPTPDEIVSVMNKIVSADKVVAKIKSEEA